SHLDEPDDCGSTPRLRFLEFEGTRDLCPWLSVPAAIDFQDALGFDRIARRNESLVEHVRARLDGRLGLTLATPPPPQLHGFMTAFRLPARVDGPTLRKRLWDRRIEAPVVDRPDGLLLRVSTHFYNTEAEIDRLAEALPELLK